MSAKGRPERELGPLGGRGTASIRKSLLKWLALGLVAAILVAGIATYQRARDEANALFDHQLAQMAASVTGMPLAQQPPPMNSPGSDSLVVEVWRDNGVDIYLSEPQRPLPRQRELGYQTVSTDRGEWRVYSVLAGGQVVQVAQPMAVRRELAASMALSTILPLIAIVPFLAIFVWFGVARSLAPLDRLAAALGRRSLRTLAPLPEAGLPAEVGPLVAALNDLLARLDAAVGAQRAFIADAAHELRTPLTAVSLQAQLAASATSDAERATALATMRKALDRSSHLAGQLLTLAREEPGVVDRPFGPVELLALARSVIADHAAQAAAGDIDLGLAETPGMGMQERGAPATSPFPKSESSNDPATPLTKGDETGGVAFVNGDAESLRTLLSNLVDNALRYTPSGGRVDVSVAVVEGTGPTLTVRDTGPGVPASERDRIFDRFYRAPDTAHLPGSGLGLAIVRSIAERHGARLAVGLGLGGATGPGLGVTVTFPAFDPAVPGNPKPASPGS